MWLVALRFVLVLAAGATIAFALPALLDRIARALTPPLRPCTKVWALSVPLHVARYLVGSQAVACFQPDVASPRASCKATGSGSPTD